MSCTSAHSFHVFFFDNISFYLSSPQVHHICSNKDFSQPITEKLQKKDIYFKQLRKSFVFD